MPRRIAHLPVFLLILIVFQSSAQAEKLHFTYLWHLEQPIYWPDQQISGQDRYETAWQSILRTDAGAANPENNLRDIFGWPDRVAVYQHRARDSIAAMLTHPEAGAQISYSGGLIENVQSLGAAGQLGYGSNWFSWLREARNWNTIGQSKPRCDIVVFPFHHPLLPLCDESTVRKEIQLYKAAYADAWGTSPGISKGMFPPEMAFSTRLIQVLAEEGIDWVFVSGEHLSRACADFPVVFGSGGVNCDPPNAADQINPPQGNYYRLSISRGCGPAEAYPFGYTPHRIRHINPETGTPYEVIAVPCAQGIGWEDGFAPIGLGHFDALETLNDPARPMLVVLAHDGDNAWGGGFSYYMEATPNLSAAAQSAGYTTTVVEEYLADHPVPADDIVHVEDGAWVNADGDFGSPIMLNWNWPLVDSAGQVDIPNGWAEDERNWAVITAAQNRVDTAEQIAGGANINKILHPDGTTTPAERAWHYFLGALNSGYMYFGTSLDFEVKPAIACNEAVEHADTVIGDGSLDATPPTIWIPQRHPWNPGSTNFGPQYGYAQFLSNGDFWIWTFVYDVSDVTAVTLKYRVDADGVNPLDSIQNETYAGGPEVGAWQSLTMIRRPFPAGNFHNDPTINFFEMPVYIADQYYVEMTELNSVLIDYYVEATDGKGHTRKSPIQHVFIGDGSGSGGPGEDVVAVDPDPAQAGQMASISYDPSNRPLDGAALVYLHVGFNNWATVVSPDPAMNWNAAESVWQAIVPVPTTATQLDLAFNDGDGGWDNNNGQDWHFSVLGGSPAEEWQMDGTLDGDASLIASNNGLSLWAGVKGDVLYVATDDAGEGNDHFIFLAEVPGGPTSAPWAKAGQVAAWDAFLADENDNDFEGWFDATGATNAMTGLNGGVLEGTINLTEQHGSIPEIIHLAVAPYSTPDGGTLLSVSQVPASQNGDGNIDADEYIAFTTILKGDCTGNWRVDSNDVPCFVDALLGLDFGTRSASAADMNESGLPDGDDVQMFLDALFDE